MSNVGANQIHDGSKRSLEDVIDYYDAGARQNPGLDSLIRPLRLTGDEKRALLAFLQSLTSGRGSYSRVN